MQIYTPIKCDLTYLPSTKSYRLLCDENLVEKLCLPNGNPLVAFGTTGTSSLTFGDSHSQHSNRKNSFRKSR